MRLRAYNLVKGDDKMINEKMALYIAKGSLIQAYYDRTPLPSFATSLPKNFTLNTQSFTNDFATATPYALSKSRAAILDHPDADIIAAHTFYALPNISSIIVLGAQNRIIKRDETLIEGLISKEREFWIKYLLPQNPPIFELPSMYEPIAAERYLINQQIKSLEEKLKILDAQLKSALGPAEQAQCGRFRITNKKFRRKVFNKDLLPPEVYQSALVETEASRFEVRES